MPIIVVEKYQIECSECGDQETELFDTFDEARLAAQSIDYLVDTEGECWCPKCREENEEDEP